MLCKNYARNEVFKDLINKLKIGENRENIYKEIIHFCEKCFPSSPMTCVEICQIWKLKKEFRDIAEVLTRPEFTDLLNIARDDSHLKILETLIERPCSLKELGNILKESGHNQSLSILSAHHIKPLVLAGFIKKDDDIYQITPQGERMYTILTKSEIAKLPVNFNKYDEKILIALSSGPKSYVELARIMPKRSVSLSLKRLQRNELIVKPSMSGRIFYFRTKRRQTRKLSPTEMKIFKALPKEGISVRDLSVKVGVNVGGIYRYLRRLRYKRHVRKEEKASLYSITGAGRSLEQSLNIARKLIFRYNLSTK